MAVVVGTTASLAFISVRCRKKAAMTQASSIPNPHCPPSVPRRPNKKAIKAVAELYEGAIHRRNRAANYPVRR